MQKKKQPSVAPYSGNIETEPEEDQTLEFLDKDFKSAILNMFNKAMCREVRKWFLTKKQISTKKLFKKDQI